MFATDAAHARTLTLGDDADDALDAPFHAAFPDAFGLPPPAAIAAPDGGANPNTIVFVDSRVEASDSLLRDLPPGTEVVFLQPGADGLAQMAAALAERPQAGAVSIIAHGSPGDLWLGETYLSAENLAQHAATLAAIGARIEAGGDLLVYACNTAEGERGASFVQSLAELTGRDVAASNDRTGAGGDWELEISTGAIASTHMLPDQLGADYAFNLATWTATNNANTGVGSLRAALASAQNGDTVTFSSGMTVALTQVLVVNKNITIDGDLNNDNVADVTLDGQFRTQILNFTAGTTARADGLVITRGMVAGDGGNGGVDAAISKGGALYNAGALTLSNVTVTANVASGGGGGGGVTPQYAGGGGGGGGAVGGGTGGRGGDTINATGSIGSTGQGGAGGGFFNMGGRGGNSTGGLGGAAYPGYSIGSAGATASSAGLSIGGGGGGDGYNAVGGAGAGAVGGIYNDTGATLTVIGNSVISNNIGAGGGGGGGGAGGGYTHTGGAGGKGVGAIWNKGAVLITAANFSALTGNAGASGTGGGSAGSAGASPSGENNIYLDGGTLNSNYVPAPTATIVVADSALQIGETSAVTFTFSEAVTGFDNSDLTIANGSLSNVASSNGGITWTAVLTPAAGVSDSTNLIILNNTGVQNGQGAAGVGSTNSNNYAVDTVRPDATIVVADNALRVGETSLVTFTFTEAVTGFTTADLAVGNGTLTGLSSANGGITWTATLTPTAGVTGNTNIIQLDKTGIADLAGNAGSGSTDSNNYAVDTARPTASLVVASPTLGVGQTSGVTITFSEAVTGFTLADLSAANGVLSGLSSADGGITWSATLTPSAAVTDATNIITLANTGVADASGNTGTGTTDSNNYAIDTARPTAAIVVASSALAAGQTSLVTFTFSEAVSGFTTADLTVANGSLAGLSSSDGGVTWTATLTPAAAVTDATNLITLDNTGVADAAGNAGTGTTNSNNYAIDTVRPSATIVVADTALRIGETSLVTFTFSEAVTGFTLADLSVANGSLAGLSTADNITYTATLTPTAAVTAGANLITLANSGVQDTAGNAGSGTTDSNSYAVDTVRPGAAIVVAAASLAAGQTSLVTFTFTEAVTGFSAADLSVANGAVSGLSSADGGITWTATLTPAAAISDTTNVITLANSGVADLAGNVGSGTTTSNNYAVDTQLPTASIVVADTALKIGETSLVTFSFSEAVSGFTTADLTVANGSLANLSSSDGGVTWTATLTPSAAVTDATNVITLANSGVQDAGGNAGSGTTDSNNYAIDTAPPTATVVVADTALTVGETSLVTITFAEAVSGFTTADLSVANGSVAGLASADGGITWTATLTPSAGVNDSTNLIVLNNAGVADAAGNAGSGTTDSNNYSVNTFVNSAPTGAVTIAGSAVQGQTLNASNTLADADGLGTIGYQWRADGVDLAGAVGASFTLTEAQVGKAISVVASYTDGQGTAESVASTPTGAVANVNDAPTGAVTINGVASQGQTLTAANTLADLDGLGAISYQWQADGINIGGATNASLTLDESLVGKAIGLLASYVDGHGTPEAVGATPTLPVTNTNDAPTGGVTISGVLVQGQTLTASNTLADSDGLGTVAYQWRADGVDIAGAAAASFTLTEAEVGKAISVTASYVDGRGTAESLSSPSGAPVANLNDAPTGGIAISGAAIQGQTLSAVSTLADADGLGTLSYQWQADGANIAGATGASFTLTEAQVGKAIGLVASYVDGHGTPEAASAAPTQPVANANDAPTGSVTISGNAVQGQTMTAANTLADADGLGTIAYQWRADGVDIAGATGGAFTLSEAQVGKAITVVASYVDARGTPEAVASSASSAVANLNDAPTGTVTFSGNAAEGQTLTAASNLADADGLGTIAYQWQAGGVAIGGAVNATYTLTAAEVGKIITVVASYVDGHGTAESVASAASTAVTPSAPPPTNTTVDGVPVQTVVGQNPVTGLPEQIVNAPIVTPSRPEDSTTPNSTLADIPLTASGGSGAGSLSAGVTVSLPTGSGFQSSGSATLLTGDQALLDLIARIDNKTVNGSPAEQAMMAQATQFLGALPGATLLATRTLVPVVAAGTTLSQPIIITGAAPATGAGGIAASAIGLVIDATSLPVSAVLQLDNVDFAAIVGAATLRGGAGQNVVIGDEAAQNIVLGPDDDILFGGGGDDVIGSAAGNDRLDGGSGRDIVFGGIGNDTLAGGTGADMLQGGRSDQGRWDFYLNAQGQVVGMHNTALVDAAVTETLTRADLNLSVGKLAFAQAGQEELQSLSLLYHAAFGRTPDLAGLSYWTQAGRSAPELVRSFMQSNEWKDGLGKLGDVEFVNQLYKNALGRAGTADEITSSLARITAAADHEQGRAQVFDAVALGAAHRTAWQGANGVALGGEVLAQEQGWIKGGGDDRLDGGAGNDLLVGGDGNDTVVYAGARANYAIGLTSDGQVTVTDRTSGDIDRIVQVEQGVFADGTMDLSFTNAAQPLLQQFGLMYQALLNRAADLTGLNYWISSGASATAVAAQFLGSAEFRQQSGTLSDEAFVNLLFQNAVEHGPSADHLAFWDSYLDTHTRADMVATLTQSTELLTGQYGTDGLWLH